MLSLCYCCILWDRRWKIYALQIMLFWYSKLSYPASSGYIFTVWAIVRKVASTTIQICLEIWTNKYKKGFFLFLNWFRAWRESCMSRPELSQFFYSCETCAIWWQTWRLIFLRIVWQILCMHDRKLNGCQQRVLFACQLTQQKCTLCSQGKQKFLSWYKLVRFL